MGTSCALPSDHPGRWSELAAGTEQATGIKLTFNQFVGGFLGECQKAPSGVNQTRKLEILASEGVRFDGKGKLTDRGRLWSDFRVEEKKS